MDRRLVLLAALPAIGYSAPDRDALCSPQRSSRSPCAHFAGDGLSAPDAVAAVGVELPAQVVADHRVAPLADELAPPPVVGQLLLVGQLHRPGLLEQVGLRAVDGVGVRRVGARPVQAGAGRGGRRRDLDDLLRRRRGRQRGERPEDRHLRARDRVEERDDEHRQRTGQHAGAEAARRVELRGVECGRGTAERAVKRGARTGDPADRCWGAKRRSMSIVIMPLPIAMIRIGPAGGASTGSRDAANDPVPAGRARLVRVRTRIAARADERSAGGSSGDAA